MTTFDYLAIIGAGAWLPSVIGFVRKQFIKPKFRITPAEQVQIGYTTYGPVINLQCALSTERTGALVEKIEATIKHVDGDSHTLTWKWLEETTSVIRPWSGRGGGTVSKNDLAIALKVDTTNVAQKLIHFEDNSFHSDASRYAKPFAKHISFLRLKNPDGFEADLLDSEKYHELISFFKNGLYWKVGDYELNLDVYIAKLDKPHTEEFAFALTQQEIDSLKKNNDVLPAAIENLFRAKGDNEDSNAANEDWNWVNTDISRSA